MELIKPQSWENCDKSIKEYILKTEKALEVYCSNMPVNKNKKNTGGILWNKEELMESRNYAIERKNEILAITHAHA